LGDDYNQNMVVKNHAKYSGFYKDGTLGQEILYYFIEIYEYDRYNFFKNMANDEYYLINNVDDIDKVNIKIDEFFSNKYWQNEYPAINGVIYIDKSSDIVSSVGIETVIFVNELYLQPTNNIYINDGINFKDNKEDVTDTNNDVVINMDALKTKLEGFNINPQIQVGGHYKKYMKYKNKYMKLKKLKY
jgi:hypothetical protein